MTAMTHAPPARALLRAPKWLLSLAVALCALTASRVSADEGSDEGSDASRASGADPTVDAEVVEGIDDIEDFTLSPVVITGSRAPRAKRDEAAAVEVISAEDIQRAGARNAAEALEEHPGLDVSRSFRGASVRIQGMEPEHVLILIDGERAIGRVDGVIDLSRFAVEGIDQVEVVKGAGSALYGSDALGGVVNIITRDPAPGTEAQAQARYGSFNTVDLSGRAAGAGARWSAQLAGGFHSGDGWDLSPEDAATTASGFRAVNATSRAHIDLTPDTSLRASAEYTQRRQDGVDLGAAGAVLDRRSFLRTARGSLTSVTRWRALTAHTRADVGEAGGAASPTTLRVRASYSHLNDQFELDQRGGRALDQSQDTTERLTEVSAQLDATPHPQHTLSAGLDTFYQGLRSPRLDPSGEGDRAWAALFTQYTYAPFAPQAGGVAGGVAGAAGPRLLLNAGARLDLDSQFGAQPSPRVALRYDPIPALALRASYGWGFRAPTFRELLLRFENAGVGYVVSGNPDLRPETSQSAQVAAELQPLSWLWVSCGGFLNHLSDLIQIGTLSASTADDPLTRFGYVNIGRAQTLGLEAVIRVEPRAGLLFEVSYTLTRARDLDADAPLEGRATHRGTARVAYAIPTWGLDLSARAAFVGPRLFAQDPLPDGTPSFQQTAPYASLDLRAAQTLGPYLQLSITAENLLNAGDPTYLPLRPLTLSGGLTASY
jgi:outer membrane receptor for ferrienterochelin and colicins